MVSDSGSLWAPFPWCEIQHPNQPHEGLIERENGEKKKNHEQQQMEKGRQSPKNIYSPN